MIGGVSSSIKWGEKRRVFYPSACTATQNAEKYFSTTQVLPSEHQDQKCHFFTDDNTVYMYETTAQVVKYVA